MSHLATVRGEPLFALTACGVLLLVLSCGLVLSILHLIQKKKDVLQVITPFPCSTKLSTKSIMLINVKMPTIVGILHFSSRINATYVNFNALNIFTFQHLSLYEQLNFHAQFS